MTTRTTATALPPIVSREEWEAARQALLEREKTHTRERDAISAQRRRLPMVKIDKNYVFAGEEGEVSLLDLFEGKSQLIVHHFMFDPAWEAGCPSCSNLADQWGPVEHLHARDKHMVMISRAPVGKLRVYRQRMGWDVPWYSSYATTFNRDVGVTDDDGESPGISVFLRDGDSIYRTYFTSGRGVESLSGLAGLLDVTPYGRQETWEDSPEGWPQDEPYSWVRRHDEYQDDEPEAN